MCQTDITQQHTKFMLLALQQAKKAQALGEVPVGAVIVKDGKVIASGYNKRESKKNALLHAELIAIDKACKKLCGWRLWQCTLYVTLEPCPMCTGAIINSRINTVVFGTTDNKTGCCGSVTNFFEMPFNHKPQVISGICKDECAELMNNFFKELREKNKSKPKWQPVIKTEN